MSIELEDLIGLNKTRVAGMPIVESQAVAQQILVAAPKAPSLAIAGMRHSQGGHTALQDGQVMLTETMRHVSYDKGSKTFTAGAGATWSQIHHVLQEHGRAPLVHQSSGHFTVGGSLAVNCHGRDPSQGPIGNTVRSISVLCGNGDIVVATPESKDVLFKAVIGGYGACGIILEATFDTTENTPLEEIRQITSIDNYAAAYLRHLPERAIGGFAELHYGWLCCVEGKPFLNSVLAVDYVRNKNLSVPGQLAPLKNEAWGMSEILSASWAVAKSDPSFKSQLWDKLIDPTSFLHGRSGEWRLNWMRASVSFTATRGGPVGGTNDRVELLQEYFVPLEKFNDMIRAMRTALNVGNPAGINLLTCTVRVVMKDQVSTVLSYARQEKTVCIALDATVPLTSEGGRRVPTAKVTEVFQRLIAKAIELGGTFYLPYYRFADAKMHFNKGYPNARENLLHAIQTYDPDKKIWNSFLEQYFADT